MRYRVPDRVLGYMLLLPLIIWIFMVVAYPLGATIWLSFTNQTVAASEANFIGLANYKRLIFEPAFHTALKNSAIWTFGNAIVQIILGYTVALLLNYPLRRSRFVEPVILLPWIIPTVTMALMWRWMFDASSGVINYILKEFQLIQQPLNLLGSLEGPMPTLILINSWRWFPFLAVLILAALQNIPQEEYDAATLDGASFLQQFTDISLPYLLPTLVVVGLLGTLWSFNIFDVIYIITRGGPVDVTTTLPVLIYRTAFEAYRMGSAATYAVLMFAILAVFAILFLYGGQIVKGIRKRVANARGSTYQGSVR